MLEPILLTILTLCVVGVLAAALLLVYQARVSRRSTDRLSKALRDLMVTVSNSEVRGLPARLADSADNIKTLAQVIESYHKGAIAAAEAQVSATTTLEHTVSEFKDLMFSRSGDRGIENYDEDAAQREHEITELMRAGISRMEAEARVKEKNIYAGLNGLRG